MRLSRLSLLLILTICASQISVAQRISDRGVLNAMQLELERSMEELAKQPEPPFYLSYEITDRYSASVSANMGKVTSTTESGSTYFDIDLRVGTPQLDNTRLNTQNRGSTRLGSLSDADAIRNTLWLLTDSEYKSASEQLVQVRSEKQVTIDSSSDAPDFVASVKEEHSELHNPIVFDRETWEKRLERVSDVFAHHKTIYVGETSASIQKATRYFVNSEGSRIQTDDNTYTISLRVITRAEDGSNLMLYENYHAHDDKGLPSNRELVQKAEDLVTKLIRLRAAPKVEPYAGPAILSGRASGVLFHEILGHRLEGHRLKAASDAQTFKDFVNEKVLPANFSVVFDPEPREFQGIDLLGTYTFDNEGIRGQRVSVIQEGILKRFLLGRSTLNDFRESNGHGRKAIGHHPVARQSNLFVEVENPVTTVELQNQLIEILKERNLEYGLLFDEITGGYTITSRALPNAFTVSPIIVYKIYRDGTRQLVRGVDLIGTPLSVFDSILAGADDPSVFNGQCGAESGLVPVSAISPSILVGQLEVQRSPQSQTILPVLPPPEA